MKEEEKNKNKGRKEGRKEGREEGREERENKKLSGRRGRKKRVIFFDNLKVISFFYFCQYIFFLRTTAK